MPNKTARIVAAAFTGIVFSACNRGGATRPDFIEKADAICREAERKARQLEKPQSIDKLDDFMQEAQDITRNMLDDLRTLEPPPQDRGTIDSLFEEIEEVVGYLPEVADAYEARDQERLDAIGRKLQSAAGRASEIATDYGLEVCGRTVKTGTT